MEDINQPQRHSAVWEFFTKKPNLIANCNICKKDYSYKASVSNLTKHWRRKHMSRADYDTSDCSDDEASVASNQPQRNSAVWKYFTKKPNLIANCNICKKDYSYRGSLSNLTKHRRRKHMNRADDDDTSDCSDEGASGHCNDATKSLNRNTKKDREVKSTWQFFEVLDSDQFVARCKICDKDISYDTMAHLTEHAKEHDILLSDDDEDWTGKQEKRNNKKPGKRANSSSVWKFMEIIDEDTKNAVCKLCRKQLSFMTGSSNLRKHIKRAHAHVAIDKDVLESNDQKVFIAADGQLYEVASSDGEEPKDPIQTDEVYLEQSIDNNDVIEQNVTPPKRIKHSNKKLKRELNTQGRFRIDDTSMDIPENTCDTNMGIPQNTRDSKKNTLKHDSLNIFGQYVISLLRQLPENVSDQLQSDFIKQIFAAKIALKTSWPVTLHEEPITVVVNNGANNGIPEIIVNKASDVITTENSDKNVNTDTSNEKS